MEALAAAGISAVHRDGRLRASDRIVHPDRVASLARSSAAGRVHVSQSPQFPPCLLYPRPPRILRLSRGGGEQHALLPDSLRPTRRRVVLCSAVPAISCAIG